MVCTRCQGSGFLNIEQVPADVLALFDKTGEVQHVVAWMEATSENHDVSVCDCCGDGETWYGTPGEHYGRDDPPGRDGPYASNGGLCECN